jgi:hypothetical protein
MHKSLPKAHKQAISRVEHAIEYYSKIISIVRYSHSLSDIYRKLGNDCARNLSMQWRIEVNPKFRAMQGLPTELSKSNIESQILQPLEHIKSVYSAIDKGLLDQTLNYECEYRDTLWYEGCDQGISGWVARFFGYPISDIHICVDEINPSNTRELSDLIIHEASHKFGGTFDNGFIENAHVYENTPSITEKNNLWLNRVQRLMDDSNSNGIPDYLENKQRPLFSNDLNKNGIPDYLENNNRYGGMDGNPNTPF